MLQALELQPSKGQHMLYSNLSAAYLQLGKHEAALQAAKASVDLAPKGFHMVRSGHQCAARSLPYDSSTRKLRFLA
jgi:hypothetical protein